MSYLPTLYLKMKNTPNYHKWQERQGTPPTRLGQRSTTGELETEAFAPIRIQEERQIGLPSSSADGHQANGTFSIPEGEEGQAQYGGCSLFLGVEDWGRLIIRDEGSKVATEWGTGTQPVTYAYDEADRMVRLTTFRVDAGEISVDPSGRTDGDTTTWTYHTATGLELRKTYADGSSIVKTYDSFNRLATETNARGLVKTFTYEQARGLLTAISFSDATPGQSYAYNHLGQLTQVTDAAGTRTLGYNAYNEPETDSLLVGNHTHLITRTERRLRTQYGLYLRTERAGATHRQHNLRDGRAHCYGGLPTREFAQNICVAVPDGKQPTRRDDHAQLDELGMGV